MSYSINGVTYSRLTDMVFDVAARWYFEDTIDKGITKLEEHMVNDDYTEALDPFIVWNMVNPMLAIDGEDIRFVSAGLLSAAREELTLIERDKMRVG